MAFIDRHRSNFVYWGRREYVHGSHMIYGLMEAADKWDIGSVLRMSAYFREPLRSQGTYYLYRTRRQAQEEHWDFRAAFQITTPSGAFAVGLAPDSLREVVKSTADNENEIVAGHWIDRPKKTAGLTGYPESLFINAVIALNKKLLNELLPEGSWLMARLDLNLEECRLKIGGEIRVELVSTIGNLSTRSAVFLSGSKVGEIFFNRRDE